MTKQIKELKIQKTEQSPELAEFVRELQEGMQQNIKDMQLQIADAEKELAYRRSLGENI
jgi:gas vesicle protein